jgi:hypothetical protein
MDGLWSVTFSGRGGTGSGVVVFDKGRVFGGDSYFYWTGTYSIQNSKVEATIDAASHSGAAAGTILGTVAQRFSLTMTAPEPTSPVAGTVVRASGAIGAVLTKRA